jgi:hypothetical protein
LAIYGPFYRVERSTEIARLIEQSNEVWGKEPLGSATPQVQAHVGNLPAGCRGIEFVTEVKPSPGTPDHEARWRPGTHGVWEEDGFAKIKVKVLRNTQT